MIGVIGVPKYRGNPVLSLSLGGVGSVSDAIPNVLHASNQDRFGSRINCSFFSMFWLI